MAERSIESLLDEIKAYKQAIEDIKAEIQKNRDLWDDRDSQYERGKHSSYDHCLEIIDNIDKAESEGVSK